MQRKKEKETKTFTQDPKFKQLAKQQKEAPVVVEQPATRTVKLIYSSCCGCGCTHYDIEREVPYNSSLQDGHIVKDCFKTDKIIRER